MDRSSFKLIYFDKKKKALDLILLYLNFYQDLFKEEGKFGHLDILAAGKIDRNPNEIFSDNTQEPILILYMNHNLKPYNIKGEFVLPLYIRNSENLGIIDGERSVYKFTCKPFVYAIFNYNVNPFSIKINPKKDGKLPNIKEVIKEIVSRQPPLLSNGKSFIMSAYTKTYNFLSSKGSSTPENIKTDSEEDSFEEGRKIIDVFVPDYAKPEANRFYKESKKLIDTLKDKEDLFVIEVITLKGLPSDEIIEIERSTVGSTKISNAIRSLSDKKDKIARSIDKIRNLKNNIKNAISLRIGGFLNFINSVCSTISSGILRFTNLVNRIGALVSGFVQTLNNYVSTVINYATSLINSIVNTIHGFSNFLLNSIYSIARSISEEISSFLSFGGTGNCRNDLINSVGGLVTSFGSLFSTITNIPNEIKQNFSNSISSLNSAINNLSNIKFPSLNEVISEFEKGFKNARQNLCDSLSNAILINPCKRTTSSELLSTFKPLTDILNSIFGRVKKVDNIISSTVNSIVTQTDFIQKTENYENIPDVVRDFVRSEMVSLVTELDNDRTTVTNLINNLLSETQNFLTTLDSLIPPNSPDPMEQALDRRIDEILNIIPSLNSSVISDLLDSNSPLWQEILDFIEEYITSYISISLLNIQEALQLLSYETTTTNPIFSGNIDPIKEIQIDFGIDIEEVKAFDEVTKKIVKRLNKTIIYPVYEGTIFTALNKAISDLSPTPFANFLSIVYYTKDGKSHAFFRYRLYPGEMELGRSDIEICSGKTCPVPFGQEFFLTIQSGMARRTGEFYKHKLNVNNRFSGFPSAKIKFSSVLNGLNYSTEIDIKEQFSKLVFCGSSLFSEEKNFLTVSLPESDNHLSHLPVSLEDTSYDGLMIAKILGDIANTMVENAIIQHEVNFTGSEAYAFFLLLWPGDLIVGNVIPLIDKTPYILKSPHIYFPRYLITKKRFQYLNTDYKVIVEKYVNLDFNQPFRIDFILYSNDDGMNTADDFSGKSHFNAIERAKDVWTMAVV